MLLNEFLKARRQIDGQQKQIEALTAGLQKVSAQRVRPVVDLKRANSPQDESAVADLRRKWSTIPKAGKR